MRPLPAGDTGGIVVGWLAKLVALFAVLGVLVFDGASLGVAELGVTDQAAGASRAASAELVAGGTPQNAYDAAVGTIDMSADDVDVPATGFAVAADRSVTVTVVRTVSTLVLHRIPGSDRWLTVDAVSTAGPG